MTIPSEHAVSVEKGTGLHHQAVLFGAELLTSHVAESQPKHQGCQRVVGVGLEGRHVLAKGVLVGASHQAIVTVQDAEGKVIWVSRHQPHEETVVSDIVSPHDHQVEQVPDRALVDILDHKLPHEVVGVVGVAIEEGGKETEKFTLLDDFSLLCKHWRTKGREGDAL